MKKNFVLRVRPDATKRAAELAAVLNVKVPTAIGYLVLLWQWTLSLKTEAAPDGIVRGRAGCLRLEAACLWDGKRGALVEALVELDLVARERKKLRVKGTKPYADEWRRREAARKREIQRRAEQKAEASKESPRLVAVASNSTPSKEAIEWYQWAMTHRSHDSYKPGSDPLYGDAAIERKGTPADAAPPASFGKWFDDRIREGISPDALGWAWVRYLGDDNFARRQWPLPIFMTDGVFRHRITKTA